MRLDTLKDLYIHELKDLYSAERQIIKALPKMVKAATNDALASGFQEHLEQTLERMPTGWRRFFPPVITKPLAGQNAKAWKGFLRREVK